MHVRLFLLTGFVFLASLDVLAAAEKVASSVVDPAAIELNGPKARYSLLVHGKTEQSRLIDLTHDAKYTSTDAAIASVSKTGVVQGLKDGTARIEVLVQGQKHSVAVKVAGSQVPHAFHFENDIVPLLGRFGCNAAGCHGKAEGQNGFKLAVFGSDPGADYTALVKEARGRRVLFTAPEQSLLLKKAAGVMAHGGGSRIPEGTPEYATLLGWITAGCPVGDANAPHVVSVKVEPAERLMAMNTQQQLRVIARYSDNRLVDVTGQARFQSNNDTLATVSSDGLVSVEQTPGDVAVMVNFMGAVDTFRALIPQPALAEAYPQVPENNFVDTLVFQRLRKLNIVPSDLADDADYLRRVYLDIIGTLPTPTEARRFLADKNPKRRALLVDELLARPEFADYWALKWADLLRVEREILGHKRAYAYYRWIHASLAQNKPLDRFAREILTAEGLPEEVGPANFYKVTAKPGEMAGTFAQVFLGVRIACAECHHHPFDRWDQVDYFGMQAFFTPVGFRTSGRGEILQTSGTPSARHPRTGKTVFAHPLGEKTPDEAGAADSRFELADWLTSPKNPWFARNLVNRTWAHFLGRGLIDPVDDVRDTNPPSNPELLDALAKHLVDVKYDFKALIRTVTASRVYQMTSKPNKTNVKDELNHSRALFRRIDAEVLLDMVSQTTGIGEKFTGMPVGTRAVQLWDSKATHYFLKLFGRPSRISACDCERIHEPSVAQVLHISNAPEIQAKISHARGAIALLSQRFPENGALVEEMYLTFFSRFPSAAEKQNALDYLTRKADQRRQAAEDLAWSMLNSLEFVFNH